jgi:hypothetical protein
MRRYTSPMKEASMSQHRARYRFKLQFAAAATLIWAAVNWLVMAESSPLHEHFLWHTRIPNLLRTLHTVPFMVALLASGNVHQPSPVVYFATAAVQWFLGGFMMSVLFTGFPQRPNPRDRNA